jgi:hypothetical protein
MQSLLLDDQGKVLYKSFNNLGYRVSDIKQRSGETDPLCRPAYGIDFWNGTRFTNRWLSLARPHVGHPLLQSAGERNWCRPAAGS